MTLLLVLLVLLAVLAIALAREVRADGYGRRPAPRSHLSELPAPWGGWPR